MGTLQLLSRTWGPRPLSKYFQTHIWQASSFSDYDCQLIFSLRPLLPFCLPPLFPLFSCVDNIQHTFLSLYLILHKGKASPPSLNTIISSGGLATWNIKHKAVLAGTNVVSGRTANSILIGTSLVAVLNPPAGWGQGEKHSRVTRITGLNPMTEKKKNTKTGMCKQWRGKKKRAEIRIKLEAFSLKLSERVSQCNTSFMNFFFSTLLPCDSTIYLIKYFMYP